MYELRTMLEIIFQTSKIMRRVLHDPLDIHLEVGVKDNLKQ